MSRSRSSFGSISTDFEGDLTLNDRLKVFKASHFDPDAYVTSKCQTMNEKEIRHLCAYLTDLEKASAEEMRRSVYANYSEFIRTSKEISDLEGQLLTLGNFLSTQTANIHGLAEGAYIDSVFTGPCSTHDDISDFDDREPSKIEKWLLQFVDTLEVLLAERRVDEALAALDEGEQMAEEAKERQTLSKTALSSLQTAISEQRQKLADQLAGAACQPSTRGAELHSAILALKKLGDSHRAHTLLLNSHHQKMQCHMQSIRPAQTGGAFMASLSQLVFSTIAQAASDSLAIFGEEPAYASELVTWAVKQIEAFVLLVKRHTLASAAAAGGLRAVAECVQISLDYSSLLEARGLALSPVLLRLFRPFVEQALSANLTRIERSSAALAAADDWSLVYTPVTSRPLGFSTSTGSLGSLAAASQPKLSSSAHRFSSMVQELMEEVGPLESLQLGTPTLEGLLEVFNSYINLLIKALPGSMENEENLEGSVNKLVRMAESEAQQIALLANASLLADELLPRAASKLAPLIPSSRPDSTPRRGSDRQNRFPEQREWKRRLQRSVDRLRDSFCRQHALELIFTEDGNVRLSAQMYTDINGNEEPEWFPSPIYQELFTTLTYIASIATDMFVGRERFATVLLMRLTETVILWLSNDQTFWEDIEEGPRPLGPLGLQQFYLDMEFVILFSSQGRYLSRHLHQVIKNIIGRAIEAVAATGIDPYRMLPEDEWFADVAQIAIKMLTGKASFGNVDRDVTSPTASVSARSVSSARSHGSN